MITGDKLLTLLDGADKTDRDLIGYVCNGLQAYDINQRPVYPDPIQALLFAWEGEVKRISEMYAQWEAEAKRLTAHEVAPHEGFSKGEKGHILELKGKYFFHKRNIRKMTDEAAREYLRPLPSGILKDQLTWVVDFKLYLERQPDGYGKRMGLRLREVADSLEEHGRVYLEEFDQELIDKVQALINSLMELVSNGKPIPFQWVVRVFMGRNEVIDGLGAGLMGCYYDRSNVQRFIDADEERNSGKFQDSTPKDKTDKRDKSPAQAGGDVEASTEETAQAEDWPVAGEEDSGWVDKYIASRRGKGIPNEVIAWELSQRHITHLKIARIFGLTDGINQDQIGALKQRGRRFCEKGKALAGQFKNGKA